LLGVRFLQVKEHVGAPLFLYRCQPNGEKAQVSLSVKRANQSRSSVLIVAILRRSAVAPSERFFGMETWPKKFAAPRNDLLNKCCNKV
jgi:hypothetical protein